MNLPEIRKRIDRVDSQIIALLGKRLELSVRTRHLKPQLQAEEREKEVQAKIKAESLGLLEAEFSGHVYEMILAESRRLQGQELCLIGFQGEHGAFSEMALRAYNTNAMGIPHTDFAEVFAGLNAGVIDLAVIPIENSLAGGVREVEEEILKSDVQIRAEINLPIVQCLMALPETNHRELRCVYSHPQALAQCRAFLARNHLEARPYYDTAGAAAMLARERPGGAAVIASELCSRLYGLEILKEGVQDSSLNVTRFFVLSREIVEQDGTKCSLVFSTPDKPGALAEALREFANANLNLTRLESRPLPDKPGQFAFLVDFEGSIKDARVLKVIDHIRENSSLFKLLGCYNQIKL